MKVYFLWISILLACTTTCLKANSNNSKDSTWLANTYLANYSSLAYSVKIQLYKKSFTGLLVVKKQDDVVKIAFITELGLKLFEFTFNNGVFEKNYCNEYMDRKMVISGLERDFRGLFIYPDQIKKTNSTSKKCIGKSGKYRLKYLGENSNQIKKVILSKNGFRKIKIVDYSYTIDGLLDQVKIKHKGVKLSFVFNKIKL